RPRGLHGLPRRGLSGDGVRSPGANSGKRGRRWSSLAKVEAILLAEFPMADDTPPSSASDKSEKEHKPPKGATHKVAWTSDAGDTAEIEVISEWIVLRKKERPAAEMFHTYYRLAEAPGKVERRRPISFVFNGGPGASSAYLHVGGLSPRRVLFKPDGN